MKNGFLAIPLVILVILSFKIEKDNSAPMQQVKEKEDAEIIGHLKIALIGYEIVDSSIASKEVAEMFIEMLKPAMESELVFNDTRSADIVKIDNSTGYNRRILYDRSSNTGYHFLTRDSVDYFFKMRDLNDVISEFDSSDEEIAELDAKIQEMVKVKKYQESKTEIFGFKCDEITIMQPDDFSKVYTISYMTDEIPFLTEAMGPLSKFFTGAPLKTIMFLNGLKITIGAVEYNEDATLKMFLEFNPEKYKELTYEQYEEMKNN